MVTVIDPAARGMLASDLARAGRLIGPSWPLERFVAVNPLVGLLDLGFERAVEEAQGWTGIRGRPGAHPAPRDRATRLEVTHGPAVAGAVDAVVADWCAQLVTAGTTGSVFTRWRDLAGGDPRLRRLTGLGADLGPALADVPERADDAVLSSLASLGVADEVWSDEMRGQLVRLLGWASYATWCDEWATPDDPAPRLSRMDLLAVKTVADALVSRADTGPPVSAPAPAAATRQTSVQDELEAAERSYRQDLLARLDRPSARPASLRAQAVFCIDVRSEGLRRAFEARGPYDTLGFAGFFATPIRFRPLGSSEAYPSAPVLLHPDAEVAERASSRSATSERDERRRRRRSAQRRTTTELSDGVASMYGWAEAAGWMHGGASAAQTLRPGWARPHPGPTTELDLGAAFSTDERVTLVETALKTMGLTSELAPVVVLCAHRSTTTANPHAASLDCGACGGNPGGPNARAFAALANDPAVRSALRSRGITIGDETLFVAAEHDTTTDTVTLLDEDAVPPGRRAEVDLVMADLRSAGEVAAAERSVALPGAERGGDAPRRARRRAADWAQVRAEWGLARNAAMVVAHRDLTRGVDLGGRVFLHSYDDQADLDGTALETILTAPMVVAHWINAQYYFSSVDPDVYGSGDKVLHNPLPGVGVLTGAGGDLRIGLPWQSVAVGDRLHHEPLRLLTVVTAPRDRVDAVIERNPILEDLFGGGWVHLVVRGREDPDWWRRTRTGDWCPPEIDPDPDPDIAEAVPCSTS